MKLCFEKYYANISVTIIVSSFIVVVTYQVGLTGCVVLLCAHANQTVIVEENAKWVTGSDKDVNAQVKLVALHQERLVQVLLNNKVLLGWQLLTVPDKRDPG